MRIRLSIRRKVVLLLFVVTVAIMGAIVVLGYLGAQRFLSQAVGDDHKVMAEILADSVSDMINEEIASISALFASTSYVQAVEKSNSKYQGVNKSVIFEELSDLDQKWINAPDESDFIDSYLNRTASMDLAKQVELRKNLAEIFITDKFGGVVALSSRTTDFYQADEAWWKKSFDKGKGSVYFGGVEYDASAGVLSISFALPLKNENNEVIGVGKAVMRVGEFFGPVGNFEIGKTGHAVILDKDDNIIFHKGKTPLSGKFSQQTKQFKPLLNKRGWIIINSPHGYSGKIFIAAANITNPFLVENGMLWKVYIDQDTSEIFAPVTAYLSQNIILFCIAVILLIPVAYVFGGIIVRPIKMLQEVVEHLAKGELDYRREIKTGDEIEELSDSFYKMTSDIKKTTTSIKDLNEEVSNRKQAEDNAKKAANEWKDTFDSITDLISIQDRDFRIIKVNKAYAEAFGIKPEDLEGRICHELVHGTKEPWPTCPAKEVFVSKKAERSEFFEPKLGIYLEVLTTPILDEEGEVAGIVHVTKDISERKKAEENIKEAHGQLNQIFQQAGDGMCVIDEASNVTRINDTLLEMLGVTREDAENKNYKDVFKGALSNVAEDAMERIFKGAERIEHDVIVERAGVLKVPCIFAATPFLSRDNRIIGVVATLKDISSRKAAEQAMLETIRVKNEFTAVVSHELRTPLTAIKEGIGIVLDGSAGSINEEQEDFLGTAKRNVDRLARLINDVLDFTKIKAGKMDLKMSKNNITNVIEEVVRFEKPIAEERGLYLKKEVAENIPEVAFNSDKMIQVITNLINNALKFTETGGVSVGARVEGENVIISVEDTGMGISPEDMPKLFQEFQQLGESKHRKTGSTGLGLAISRSIIKQHGGKLWAESELGKGSKFNISLPLERKYKIMVVDDDVEFLHFCSDILKKNGYECMTSVTGGEALEKLQTQVPDVIVIDMRLPDINGYELIGRLRSDQDLEHIPILAVSGYEVELEELEKIKVLAEKSAIPRMTKPFDNDKFLNAIFGLLKL